MTPSMGRLSGSGHARTIDLVTGKAKAEYFFDPTLALPPDGDSFDSLDKKLGPPRTPATSRSKGTYGDNDDSVLFSSRHLFMPCTIVKDIETDDDYKDKTSSIPALVKTSDGQLHKISDRKKLVPLTPPEDYDGVPDVLHLPNVTEASLLHTLRVRYNRDEIYTSAGPILMSVNPYKTITMKDGLDLYAEERMLLYRNSSSKAASSVLPCHLFQVAERAYNELLTSAASIDNRRPSTPRKGEVELLELKKVNYTVHNQSIVISGESGAGKTEATKKIMQFLAGVTKNKALAAETLANGRSKTTSLEDRVLSSNPLLESFGNARTLKNDNSSRFGKFIKISFNAESGTIVGASISNYLLEKTRITTQIEGERNYHIFYQIFSGADDATLAKFKLSKGVSEFRYLGNRPTLKSRHDASAFEETMKCLDLIGLTEKEKNDVLGILSAVLHIGNITFEVVKEEEDHCGEKATISESSAESLKIACSLLDLEETKVSKALLTKTLSVGGKTIHKPQDVVQASDKRDAFAKLVYSSLFVWLVNKINATLSLEIAPPEHPEADDSMYSPLRCSYKPPVPTAFIGVLDIYGFENFENNGFEQLLINYANEKLQRYFNKQVFEVEQRMYSDEGVDWSYISFNDNQPCLDLIEGGVGNVGVLSTLDDSGGMGTAAERDVNFLALLHQKFGGVAGPSGMDAMSTTKKKKKRHSKSPNKELLCHQNFITPKFGKDRDFIIIHYAGEVRYNVTGFVEKNVETLSNELKDLGFSSSNEFSQGVFGATGSSSSVADSGTTPGRRSAIRGVSLASQFRTSLQMLVMDLECTKTHFVRCIKPNSMKAFSLFESGEVLRQLRYSGMMETIRIRREGYSNREDHGSFYKRFHILLTAKDAKNGEGITHLVKVLSQRLSLTEAEWQIGHTKIFLRTELASKLEVLAKLRRLSAARVIVKFGRKIAHSQAARILTAWMRFRLTLHRKHRRAVATSKIASTYRMHKAHKSYKATLQSAVQIQCLIRMALARKRVRVLQDPYFDMSFKELDILHMEEVLRLENAVNVKDFKTAADIEKKLVPLKVAMESKRPLTRSILESFISEVESLLEDAVSRKAFLECAPLQERLDKLIRQRADMPSIDELKEAVRLAEESVCHAAARRDFSGAAAAQAALEKANVRLEEALRSEGVDDNKSVSKNDPGVNRFQSRGELEIAIAKAANNINDAIADKDFDKATKFQAEIEELESLRPTLPSVEELKFELSDVKAQMNDAIKRKNFKEADSLQKGIEILEAKLESERATMTSKTEMEEKTERCSPEFRNEKGEKVTFASRFELEEEIKRYISLVQELAKAKKFKEASLHQRYINELEELRPSLPTEQELRSDLAKTMAEMEFAIKNKNFDKAEILHELADHLEEKLAVERKNMPQSDTYKHTILSASVVVRTPFKQPLRDSTNTSLGPARSVSKMSKNPAAPLTNNSVSKLRPKAPMISAADDTVLSVAQMLASKRGDAAIITNSAGVLAGIITDTDVTRRVVAKNLLASRTCVSDVMTSNPSCVSMSDSATDALMTMVENRFRHLPVTDASGAVVGVLDIAKCLNDAISKLEQSKEKSSNAAEEALNATFGGAGGAQAAALKQLLAPLMSQAFGGQSSPTLRTVLAGRPSTIVSPSTTIQETGHKMAEARKAALVVDNGQLVGIFGFKDMMSRAVAKELPLDFTPVSTVMTPNPESVSPDTTVLEALQIMHDNKFLTLPVCESNGSVIGVVDVMDCVYGSGGAEGWRSIFAQSMNCDDLTDTASVCSIRSGSVNRSVKSSRGTRKNDTPVSKLRPKAPMISAADDTVLSVAQMLASKRGDAAIITNSAGVLAGIITDTDVTRRVVAKNLLASRTCVSDVMTSNPSCVSMSDSATDALMTMVENRFRHLPVTDASGAVVGVLDIAKCLNDAISKLEQSKEKSSNAAEEALNATFGGAGGAQAAALKQLLAPLMSQAFGGQSSPTLRTVLAGRPSTIVSPSTTIQETGHKMAEARKAALVVDNGQLVGIFGFKDMMSRAVAKELPLDFTPVSTVMTPNPESVSPDTTVLEALQIMHDNKFLTLPVCESNGSVIGVVDVMDCVYGSGGAEGWRSIFAQSMNCDDLTDTASVCSIRSGSVNRSVKSSRGTRKNDTPVSKLRPKAPMISAADDTVLSVAQMLASKRGDAAIITNSAGVLAGIITDTDVTRRVVAKNLLASRTCVSDVMTSNPSCVSMSDSATDALMTMVENRFRHLPVTDASGAVVGVLDIAKCLNDAISKLEQSKEKSSNAAEEALNATFGGAGGAQAAALKQLLAPLMSQAFGGQSSPTLRTVLAGRPSTIVSPSTTIQETGHKMAEARKAALVVDNGQLVGIFGFKDMMSRAVAKELPLDFTPVSTVMTPNPESVSPDTTVLEALQIMHDNKFLTLPVCESNGSVIGVVDVMDCVYGSGGAEGWRSIFAQSMNCDDLTDTASVCSIRSGSVNRSVKSSRGTRKNDTPVSKLRPKAPMISAADDTVLSVAQMLASKRGDAAIITNSAGVLAGIITDTDVTRRVVAKNLLASRTCVSDVMTSNPSCVSMSDSATDALMTMVENRFRHLPVTDASGAVVGVLDIAKCLNDAISKLEQSKEKSSNAAEEALNATFGGAGGAQAAALKQLLAPLMSQAFGGQSSPTLRTVLAGRPSTIVSPSTTIQETGHKMAEARKAALVVDNGQLVGIFGFKDMMSRAVAKELPLDFTPVSTVMTPNPESVSPDTTVLEALQIMHDNKFLTLPVCESNGSVIGVVDVMDCVYGSGGAEGWRSIFAQSMDCDDLTDTASVRSRRVRSVRSVIGSRLKDKMLVSKLRPKKPIVVGIFESVLTVSQMLAGKRGDAAIIVNADGGLAGIITDTDITRRIVAKELPARLTKVSDVMTVNPTCVTMTDSAMEALITMVENRFRHLPVTDDNGNIVGCLDIAKCLNDAISKLERAQVKNNSSAHDAFKQVTNLQGAGGANQAAALQTLLGPLLVHVLGGKSSPTLRSILVEKPLNIVSPNLTLQKVGLMMAESRKAALVVECDKLVGIFGFKDMMVRAVSKELPLDSTPVSAVMTPNPDVVSPETTVLEALQIMHDNKFLTLPVCENDGRVVGLVDVMDCVHASGGSEGWKSLFDSALDEDDASSVLTDDMSQTRPPVVVASHPNNIPLQVEIGKGLPGDQDSIGESSTLQNPISTVESRAIRSAIFDDLVIYKIVDEAGQTFVIRAGRTVGSITEALEGKIANFDPSTAALKYFDDEGDEILIKSDECLDEAVRSTAHAGNKYVKLSIKSKKRSSMNKSVVFVGGTGLVVAVAIAVTILLKPKK
ncbi:hypothetical protein ACHAXA_004300 [Cyclostephanos tholiformis]|uniref:Uncharacterized protein n=1 Tax=Cyclostephanos tholiformis TaxID=382380 RepID=A0ABD3SG19_9STRA